MKVSFLVIFYEGIEYAQSCIESILSQDVQRVGIELLVVDNGSSDGISDFILRNYPQIHLITLSKNLGFSQANNLAFSKSCGEVICCVNQDVILTKGWLRAGLDGFENRHNVVACNTNMIMPWVMSREAFLSSPKKEIPPHAYRLTFFGFAKYCSVEDHGITETNFITGGAFLIKRDFLQSEPFLFDPSLFMYGEDLDLTLRIRARGGGIVFVPEALLYHDQKEIGGPILHQLNKALMVTMNRFVVLAKRLGIVQFLFRFPFFLIGIFLKHWGLNMSLGKKVAAIPISFILAVIMVLLLPYWVFQTIYPEESHQ